MNEYGMVSVMARPVTRILHFISRFVERLIRFDSPHVGSIVITSQALLLLLLRIQFGTIHVHKLVKHLPGRVDDTLA